MIDFARGAKGGFWGASGLAALRAAVPAAKTSGDSRLPSATAPRLKPDWRKNCLRVTARVFQSVGSSFMGSMRGQDSRGSAVVATAVSGAGEPEAPERSVTLVNIVGSARLNS